MNHPLVARILALAGLSSCLFVLARSWSAIAPLPADPSQVVSWWVQTDPALAMGAILQVVAAGLCGWLLLVTTVDLLASVTGCAGLVRLARRAAPVAWREIVLRPLTVGALALPIVVAPLATAAPAYAASTTLVDPASEATSPDTSAPSTITRIEVGSDTAPVITMTREPDVVDPPAPSTTAPPPSDAPPTTAQAATVPLEEQDHTLPAPSTEAPAPDVAPPASHPAPPAEVTPEGSRTHVVVPGDSFWRIAAVHLEAELGRIPEPGEVAPYWRRLVDANRDNLAVPGNPDLIFPGDVVILPPR